MQTNQIEQENRVLDSDRQFGRTLKNIQDNELDRQFSPISSEQQLNNNSLCISSQIKVIPVKKNSQIFQQGQRNINSFVSLNPPQPDVKVESKFQSQIREFADDEEIFPIKIDVKQSNKAYDLQNNLNLEVKARFTNQKLNKEKSQYLPGVVSIKTKDIGEQQQTRVGVDLICLIDKSGSMQGLKISMVRQTLNVILNFLTDKDRLQLIVFDDYAKRLTPLKKVNDQNKQYFRQIIGTISACHGTKISRATSIAFQQLEQRRFKNNISSIFLLSDGQDTYANEKVASQVRDFQEKFTMHTFGFGQDHDAKMMVALCNLKNGSFYFVQNIELLDEYFVDALGGLISVVGEQLEINIICQPKEPFEEVKIDKTYGNMWNRISSKKYEIKLPQIASGQRKDFVFELKIPKQLNELEHSQLIHVVGVKLKIKNSLNEQIIEKDAQLELKFYTENENIKQNDEDIEVAAQYYRVKGTQVIDDARRACEQGMHEAAQKMIDQLLDDVESNNLLSEKAYETIQDLKQAKQASNKLNYNNFGQSQMLQLSSNILNQQGLNSHFSVQGVQLQQQQQSVNQNSLQFGMMLQTQSLKYNTYYTQSG